MKMLNHPLKRLSFVLFLLSSTMFVGCLLFPETTERISSYSDWKDGVGAEPESQTESFHLDSLFNPTERTINRIDIECAENESGDEKTFRRDFSIVETKANNNPYRLTVEEQIELGKFPMPLPPMVDLTEDETKSVRSQLKRDSYWHVPPGIECETCIDKLTLEGFESILKSCSESVEQHRDVTYRTQSRIDKNLNDNGPWSGISLLSSVFFLFTSILYNKTLGLLVNWIRSGS
jgi:hypothetical protein